MGKDPVEVKPEASEDTKKFLEKVREEGDVFEGIDKSEESEEEEKTEEEEKEEKESEEKESEEKEEDEKEEDEKEEDEKESEEEKKPSKSRSVRTVPVQKFNEMRKARNEAKATIAELEKRLERIKDEPKANQKASIDELSKQLADKHGLDEEFIKEFSENLVNLATSKIKLPDEIVSKLDAFEKSEKLQAEEQAFEKEFKAVLEEFPSAASRKDVIKRLAFTEGYTTTPIRTLIIQDLYDNPIKATAERSSTGKPADKIFDYENLTEDDIKNMSDEEFAKYIKYQESKGG